MSWQDRHLESDRSAARARRILGHGEERAAQRRAVETGATRRGEGPGEEGVSCRRRPLRGRPRPGRVALGTRSGSWVGSTWWVTSIGVILDLGTRPQGGAPTSADSMRSGGGRLHKKAGVAAGLSGTRECGPMERERMA